MFKRNLLSSMLLFITLIILPATAFAAAQLSISPSGSNGVFVLKGTGMQAVAGIQASIFYDDKTLTSPRVTLGSLVAGKLNYVNPSQPIRMAIIDTQVIGGSGAGIIATIQFQRIGESLGRIIKLDNIILLDGNNRQLPMLTPVVTNPIAATPSNEQLTSEGDAANTGGGAVTGDTANTGGGIVAGTGNFVGGSLTFPPSDTAVNEKKGAPAPKEEIEHPVATRDFPLPPAEAAEDKEPAPKPAAQPEPAPQPIQSVLERFRLFQGERTAKNLATLFNRESAASFSQEPAIAIADGKANVKLIITKVAGEKTPNFAFNSARYVSLTRFDDGEWEIEVKPDPGAVKASVSMLLNGTVQEFPLTVTPKAEVLLRKAGEASEADFLLYLKELGTAAAPKYDLNGDGKRDYQDDYIYTANYLLKMEEKANKKKKP